MAEMTEAIDRIATCAEQRKFRSFFRSWRWIICSENDSLYGSDTINTTIDLTPKQIKEIELASGGCPSKLSPNQIKEITKHYPFQLPIEFYELYQRGNGCLPIGKDCEKDWNPLDNYFTFPDGDKPFYPIQKALERYQALTNHRESYGGNIEPRWFPISEFEDWMQVIIGSEEQQETSPVLYFGTDGFNGFKAKVEWPSLTNMLLAWAEVIERDLNENHPVDREEVIAIWEKYGWRR